MTSHATIQFMDDCMLISGKLDFATVIALHQQGDQWLRAKAPVKCYVDLADVEEANSAGTTLLLSWLRTARASHKELIVKHLPEQMTNLMALIGLGDLLSSMALLEEL